MTYIILCVSRIVPVVDLLTLAAAFLVDAGRDPAVEEINPDKQDADDLPRNRHAVYQKRGAESDDEHGEHKIQDVSVFHCQ